MQFLYATDIAAEAELEDDLGQARDQYVAWLDADSLMGNPRDSLARLHDLMQQGSEGLGRVL